MKVTSSGLSVPSEASNLSVTLKQTACSYTQHSSSMSSEASAKDTSCLGSFCTTVINFFKSIFRFLFCCETTATAATTATVTDIVDQMTTASIFERDQWINEMKPYFNDITNATCEIEFYVNSSKIFCTKSTDGVELKFGILGYISKQKNLVNLNNDDYRVKFKHKQNNSSADKTIKFVLENGALKTRLIDQFKLGGR